jgi:hypothetical protein
MNDKYLEEEIVLTKVLSNGTNCCDYRLVKYKMNGKWTKPILEYNQEKGTNGDWDGWNMTELFEHFSHGDIAYMNKKFGMQFYISCYDEELIQTDELVEFKESITEES